MKNCETCFGLHDMETDTLCPRCSIERAKLEASKAAICLRAAENKLMLLEGMLLQANQDLAQMRAMGGKTEKLG